MNIISHRGFWENDAEKNTVKAFTRAFSNNFGVETDIRDCNGNLVISHDMPNAESLLFSDFLRLYNSHQCNTTLALNIKADGLASEVQKTLLKYGVTNYFCFDMSIPDTLHYINAGLFTYIRESDIEQNIEHFSTSVQGFWVDEMLTPWVGSAKLAKLQSVGLPMCIVSPELHRRDFGTQWGEIKKLGSYANIALCTDFPQKATEFFRIV